MPSGISQLIPHRTFVLQPPTLDTLNEHIKIDESAREISLSIEEEVMLHAEWGINQFIVFYSIALLVYIYIHFQ